MNLFKIFKNGIIKDNPIFVQLIGMCSVLAVSSSVTSSLAMGAAVTVVLIGSNFVVSLLRNIIPNKIRIPAFIVIIATFVTMIEILLKAYAPPIYDSLGIFLPLIVVNCAILARAEAFAYKNGVLPSVVDALGNGIGYTLAIALLGTVREIFGAGSFMGIELFGQGFKPASIFVMPPGAFIVLGILIALFNVIRNRKSKDDLCPSEMK